MWNYKGVQKLGLLEYRNYEHWLRFLELIEDQIADLFFWDTMYNADLKGGPTKKIIPIGPRSS